MRGSAVVLLLLLVSHVCADEKPASPQREEAIETEIVSPVKLKYLLYLPQGYDTPEKRWPLLMFLHGSGERGEELAKVKIHGPPKLLDQGQAFPFVVVSPQSPQRGWDVLALNALLDEVLEKHRIDPDRVYLTGLSMGGRGTWDFAGRYPERFAAIAPICGSGNPGDARRLKNVPVWIFHGAKDEGVPLEYSEIMVRAIQKAGGEARLTVYPDAGHDSWTETYNNPQLYEWFLKQVRKPVESESK